LQKAVKLMQSKAISQLPVLDKGKPVGRLSEKSILSRVSRPQKADLKGLRVEDLMDEAMPVIQENTPFHLLSELLEHNQAVLIARKGKVKGIVSKSDLLKAMLRKK
jgi:predicted transcriptional regulator